MQKGDVEVRLMDLNNQETDDEMAPLNNPASAKFRARSTDDDASPSATEAQQPSRTTASSTFTPFNPLDPSATVITPPLPTSSAPQDQKGLSNAGKIGIGVGIALLVMWIVFGTMFFCSSRRRAKAQSRSDQDGGNGEVRINGKTFAVAIERGQTQTGASSSQHDPIEMQALTPKPPP